MIRRRSVHLGLALGRAEIAAAHGARVWCRSLGRWYAEDDSMPAEDLASIVAELREQLELTRASVAVSIALLPSIAQVRRLDFPPLRERELRRVLTRDAGRYFPRCRHDQIANGAPIAGRRRSTRPLIAATAPAGAVTTIVSAIHAQGWRIDWIGPAHWSWAAASPESGPALLVIPSDGSAVECIQTGGSRGPALLTVRRFGSEPSADSLATLRGKANVPVRSLDASTGLAARYAPVAMARGAPTLWPEALHLERARRSARRATVVSTIAAVLLMIASLADRTRLDRTRASIASERTALRHTVARVVAAQDTLVSLETRASTLVHLESTAPHWSTVLVSLATRLPSQSHLVALRGRADSLAFDGVADDAAATLAALRETPGLGAVHADAPIREELAGGHRTIEHFAVAARIVEGAAAR
jgi:Tfp pilus assembly protein PilN